MTDADADAALAARADYCRMLAACFYQPDAAFEEEGMFEAMAEAGSRFDAALAADARELGVAFAGEDHDALLVDYTRLFIGPVATLAPPYGSSWLGRDGASPVLPVLSLYEQGGFAVADDFLDLPDHAAAELEFLYLTIFRTAEATASADLDALARWEALERRFLAEHIGAWVGPFAGAIRDGTQTSFYRHLADAAERFVASERARLG
jgi:TorA maturation chaperone TorD